MITIEQFHTIILYLLIDLALVIAQVTVYQLAP